MLSIKNMNPVEGTRGFSPEVKFNVVTNYLVTGNLKIAAASVGVAYETVKKWHQADWWKEYEYEIANSKRTETNNKLSKLVDKSLSLLEDRLDNGDYIVNNKTGEICRRPVQLRDLNQVMNNILIRQEAIEKQRKEQQIYQKTESMADSLKLLAEEFSKFSGKRRQEVIDVEDIEIKEAEDAIHDQRETGLQEGIPEVPGKTRTDQEQDGAQLRTSGIDEGGLGPKGGW